MILRRVLLVCVPTVSALAAALAGYWVWGAGRIEEGIQSWAEQQRARGYEIAFEGPAVDGFPFFHDARLDRPAVGSPDGWRWEGPPVSGRAPLWDPRSIVLTFPGQHRLRRPGAAEQSRIELELGDGVAALRLRLDGRLAGMEARLERVELRAPEVGVAKAATLRLSAEPVYPETPAMPVQYGFSGAATGLILPPAAAIPLDGEVEFAHLEGRLEGAIPEAEPRLALALWREAGGLLVIDRLELLWPPLDLEAQGRLTLDEALRPLGELTARVADLPALLDRLAAEGLIEPNQVAAMKLGSLAFSGGTNARGRPVTELPVSFRDGLLYLGPFPLIRLSPLL